MHYDLVIKNGFVVDGSGLPRYRADVGVRNGRIVSIGRISGPAKQTIDADGKVVTPGFIDGHTHMDAQVFWDKLGTCSCWHGVTTVVMGNCGFSLAPCSKEDRLLVMKNLEKAEDIPRAAMEAGIDWRWTTFVEFMNAVDALPKGINYACNVGHSALRTHVMGERAFTEDASEDDLARMANELRDALRAGAIGFSTSRATLHETSDGRPVASRRAAWKELERLVGGVMGELGVGVFQLAGELQGRANADRAVLADFRTRLKNLAVASGRPVTWGMFALRGAPDIWRADAALLEETAAAGGRMFAQVLDRPMNVVYSFAARVPFDRVTIGPWKELRSLPLDEQRRWIRNPDLRRKLLDAANDPQTWRTASTHGHPFSDKGPDYDWMFVWNSINGPNPSVGDVARQRNCDPHEAFLDLSIEKDLNQFFLRPIANEDEGAVLEMMRNPRSVLTFSDSGAHVQAIMDASIHTRTLSHWVRARREFTLEEAIRMITFVPANHWGFSDRGLVREGFVADLVVLDPDTVEPEMPEIAHDLPTGETRLIQKARGIAATVVGGEVLLRDGVHTGAYPGKLLRGPLAKDHSRE